MSGTMDYLKKNNFDLIRLIAAAQVMLYHAFVHLQVLDGGLRTFIAYFPGVPAFFFVSGFLISASWERNSSLHVYIVNRVLRIFPALYGVLAFSIVTLLLFYDMSTLWDNLGKLVLWGLCQVTILQDWNPDFLRSYGTGGVNGSLWTIPVELSFYAFIPLIYWLCRRLNSTHGVLLAIIVLSFGLQYLTYAAQDQLPVMLFKLITKTPLPWVGMFCCGMLAQREMPRIYPLVAGRAPLFVGIYFLVAFLAYKLPWYPVLAGSSNSMGIVNYAAMCAVLLAVAYSGREMAERLLRRNDISYGVYIFHMPVINVFVHTGIKGWTGFLPAVALTVVLAILSWLAIEKPSLGLRQWALYRR